MLEPSGRGIKTNKQTIKINIIQNWGSNALPKHAAMGVVSCWYVSVASCFICTDLEATEYLFQGESISQGQLGRFCIKGTMTSFFRELKTPASPSGCVRTAWAVNSERCTWKTILHLFWQLWFHTWFAEMFCCIRGHLECIFLLKKW